MKRVIVLVGLSSLLGCPLKAQTSSTMPSSNSASASSSSESASNGGDGGNVTVPDIVGRTQGEAEEAVASAGLRGGIRVGNDPGSYDVATAKICTQTPGGGQQSSPSLFVSVRFCLASKAAVDDEGDLTGLTVEAAKQKIKDAGYNGEVRIAELYEYDQDCKDGTVCRFDPRRWYLKQERSMTLHVNRKLSISTPE